MKRTSKQPAVSAIPAPGYADWLQALSRRYRQSQIKAAIAVNSEMLRFYFSLGADIVRMEKDQPWGSGFLKRLSSDLRKAMPDANCFSENNLIYMRCFFELYSPFLPTPQVVGKSSVRIAPQPVGKIPEKPTPQPVAVDGSRSDDSNLESEHLGQLGLYVSAVNHLLKKPSHEPTIGLLICKTKDNTMVKWALESTRQPVGVSEYRTATAFRPKSPPTFPPSPKSNPPFPPCPPPPNPSASASSDGRSPPLSPLTSSPAPLARRARKKPSLLSPSPHSRAPPFPLLGVLLLPSHLRPPPQQS